MERVCPGAAVAADADSLNGSQLVREARSDLIMLKCFYSNYFLSALSLLPLLALLPIQSHVSVCAPVALSIFI